MSLVLQSMTRRSSWTGASSLREPAPACSTPQLLPACSCGLIRQAQHDLQERFGFRLARYNQNFQFDTLPDEVPLGEVRARWALPLRPRRQRPPGPPQAKEGDLVFYKGRYVKEGKAAQRLGIVHVEMFSPGPTGRGTVGARWNAGLVSEFPDMAFTAKAWTDVEIHIRFVSTGEHADTPWQRTGSPCSPTGPSSPGCVGSAVRNMKACGRTGKGPLGREMRAVCLQAPCRPRSNRACRAQSKTVMARRRVVERGSDSVGAKRSVRQVSLLSVNTSLTYPAPSAARVRNLLPQRPASGQSLFQLHTSRTHTPRCPLLASPWAPTRATS